MEAGTDQSTRHPREVMEDAVTVLGNTVSQESKT